MEVSSVFSVLKGLCKLLYTSWRGDSILFVIGREGGREGEGREGEGREGGREGGGRERGGREGEGREGEGREGGREGGGRERGGREGGRREGEGRRGEGGREGGREREREGPAQVTDLHNADKNGQDLLALKRVFSLEPSGHCLICLVHDGLDLCTHIFPGRTTGTAHSCLHSCNTLWGRKTRNKHHWF